MNQKKLSGVGNYILAEGLYKANIDPWCSVQSLNDDTLVTLLHALRETAVASLAAQGMTRRGGTFRTVDGDTGNFTFQLQVYGRQRCAQGMFMYALYILCYIYVYMSMYIYLYVGRQHCLERCQWAAWTDHMVCGKADSRQ